MKGAHDMGGTGGRGPINPELNEPVFHAPWEGRVFGLRRLLVPWGLGGNWGSFRFAQERLPAADYLRLSYYERWFIALVNVLKAHGVVTDAELAGGASDPEATRPERRERPPQAPLGFGLLALDVPARFAVGDSVRARRVSPPGHTRLPGYAQGKHGTVIRDNGVYALQDTDEHGQQLSDFPQHVYTVRFTARELWGERGNDRDAVYVELWEDYLAPA
ncbi:MAG: nitrile hydratase subunit beta [Acidobacteria bacterium]|nr:nitrile hydratase subunit beta [Acidobacteriota bacterium]